MKRSDMVELVTTLLERHNSNYVDDRKKLADTILFALERQGMLPPMSRRFIEDEKINEILYEYRWENE